MPTFRTYTAADAENALLQDWPGNWPRLENRVSQHHVTVKQYRELKDLIERRAGERDIESFLSSNREALSMAVWMFSTGHHMSWIFPKAEIAPTTGNQGGLTPDYLLAGASSDGISWFVLELKGADKAAFRTNGRAAYLSSDATRGVCQLMTYLDVCARDQAYLRDGAALIGMREPRGILLIGTEEETADPLKRALKAAWNRMNPKLQIRSYSALVRQLASKLQDFGKLQT